MQYSVNNTFKIGTIFTTESNAIWTYHLTNQIHLHFSDVIGPISVDLRDSLGFPTEFLQTLDFTGKNPNGTLTGIGDELMKGVIDLGTPLSVILPFRQKYLTFLHPLKSSRINIHFLQPSNKEFQKLLLFKPFSWGSWGCIYFVVFLAFCSITFLTILNGETCFGSSKKYSIRNIVFWMVGSFYTKAAFDVNPRAISTKLAVLVIMMFSFVLMAIYTASIVVSLSTPFIPIKEFQDLLENKYIISAYPGIPYFQQFIKDVNVADKLANESLGHFTSTKEAISEMFQRPERKGAVFEFDLGFYEICKSVGCASDEELCKASVFQAETVIPLAMFVRRSESWKLKDLLNRKLLNLMERGLNNKYQVQHKTFTQPLCLDREVFAFDKATLTDVLAIHAVLILGVMISCGILIGEGIHVAQNRVKELPSH